MVQNVLKDIKINTLQTDETMDDDASTLSI